MNTTQPLNVKNVGMVFGEFMKGQTRKGKPLSYTQLKDQYAPTLLEYANGLTQEASKLEKVKKIRDRLAQLDFEEIQRRQLELRDDHTTTGKEIEEMRELQEKQEQLTEQLQENSAQISAKMRAHKLHQQDMQNNHNDMMSVPERSKQNQASGSQDVNSTMQKCFAAHEKGKKT